METSRYDPMKLIYHYDSMEHGKARTDAIRYAIEQADLNKDIEYMVYFRAELCEEAEWYGNGLDIVTVFPELLAIIDKYTSTKIDLNQGFYNIPEDILWSYEDLLSVCSEFYQIPMEDCINFHNDFKRRWLEAGRSQREPYRMLLEFYLDTGNMDNAAKILPLLKTSSMAKYDCAGCAANTELSYYLLNNEKDKADKIAEKIEDGTLRCGSYLSNSIPRMNKHYLKYYIMHGDYEKAAQKAYMLERLRSDAIDYKLWASFMCAYVYNNTGRGLRIYKKYWKDIENEQRPEYMYYSFKDAACFFMGLKRQRGTGNIKLQLDNTFPLYNEDNIYSLDSLAEYYYKRSEDVAEKFDGRNGTDKYIKELEMSVENILSYKLDVS